MKKVVFSEEFYEKVNKLAGEYCEKHFENDDNEPFVTISGEVECDGFLVGFNAEVECDWVDESFDHAFGTWHDPYAGYGFGKYLGIVDVEVYDEDGEEVEGFSIEESYKCLKAA